MGAAGHDLGPAARTLHSRARPGNRKFLGTATAQALAAASVDENLQFVRYLVDPRKAEGLRQTFTLAIEGDARMRRLELRNGVLVIIDVAAPAPTHLQLTRQELAAFVLGTRPPARPPL
jgi:alkyl sulfatase BDS1-like metallo-beta-lactamase superfamily hydrolase